jgi:hypothetical protein
MKLNDAIAEELNEKLANKVHKSKSCYDWRSVNQYVLVSSTLWNL